jgi:adenosylcobinamide-phosphate synthase
MLSLSFVLVCVAALALDACLGEPRRAHPIVGFGRLASLLEAKLNRADENTSGSVAAGALAMLIVVVPLVLLAFFLSYFLTGVALWCVQALVLWLALAMRSLGEHGAAVAQALLNAQRDEPADAADLSLAREKVGRIVSRDTASLDEEGIAKAATESMLENGADAVFASLFWFVLAGLPGVVLHRTVNTLDAMWGYRTARYERFGKAAARLDDVLNWLPARLTAWTFSLSALLLPPSFWGVSRDGTGGTRWQRVQGWRQQVRHWDSPNAGPVIAVGASALAVELGGGAPYHGGWKERPVLGVAGNKVSATTIYAAIKLVRIGVVVWLLVLFLLALL